MDRGAHRNKQILPISRPIKLLRFLCNCVPVTTCRPVDAAMPRFDRPPLRELVLLHTTALQFLKWINTISCELRLAVNQMTNTHLRNLFVPVH